MKKKIITALSLLCLVLFVIPFAGCSVNENSYNLVFGKNSGDLIPSVGNGAYETKALYPEEEETVTDDTGSTDESDDTNSTTSSDDTYVDPTDGFDCAEE